MSDVAIRVAGLGKQYQIGGDRKPYKTIRESITDMVLDPLRRLRAGLSADAVNGEQAFWALKDVSFEVNRGEVVGIIGRNGAGKSTLLKILSRITEPTEGEVEIAGRVGSLLEVGTGFHPELTGRENVYLNGAILGMKRSEIDRKFDEIIAFSEIERFLETPVKHYSSGMYTRLAFAVAAHLEPEILVVDEVLAVGDAAFQRKCLGRMSDVARQGRTVLFVSHQMAAIENLCSRALLLDKGRLSVQGASRDVIDLYLSSAISEHAICLEARTDRQGGGAIRFVSVACRGEKDEGVPLLRSGQPAWLLLNFRNNTAGSLRNVHIAVGLDDIQGQRIAILSSQVCGRPFETVPADVTSIGIHIPRLPLVPGRYGFTLFATVSGVIADWIQNAGHFDVSAGDYYGTGRLPDSGQGHLLIDYDCRLMESRQDVSP